MKQILLYMLAFMPVLGVQAQLQARFSASETATVYYQQGWDTEEDINAWSYSSSNSGNFTWHLVEQPPYTGQSPFSTIDPTSKYSLAVNYHNSEQQNEVCASPTIDVQPNTVLEFYACFRSVFLVYADWKLYIIDLEKEEPTLLVSGFQWSQANGFTGPAWQKFTVDLSDFGGKSCAFGFQYLGPGGEDLCIDGFKLMQTNEGENAKASINEGQQVHFIDQSAGSPTAWLWQFEGGTPTTSTEQNPVVTYGQAGNYDVTLTVTNADGTSTETRQQFVNVKAQAPQALIGLPDANYLSPWTALFIPAGASISYQDLTSGKPTEWNWTFEGGMPATSTEQNPVVTYAEEGLYGMTLSVKNSVGQSDDFMQKAIQVGGSQYVWNVGLDEQDNLGEISMGFYGYYGGTNWVGITKYAEHFEQPAVPVEIDSVQIFFTSTQAVNASAPVTVSICKPDANGMPGEVLATASVAAGDLVDDEEYYLPTEFELNKKILVDTDFFVVVEGLTNNYDEATGKSDDMCIMSLRRGEGGKSTTYHLLEDEDPDTYEPLGTYTWYKSTEDPVSLAITPRLRYTATVNGIQRPATDRPAGSAPKVVGRFTPNGQAVGAAHKGIQILRMSDGSTRKIIK